MHSPSIPAMSGQRDQELHSEGGLKGAEEGSQQLGGGGNKNEWGNINIQNKSS